MTITAIKGSRTDVYDFQHTWTGSYHNYSPDKHTSAGNRSAQTPESEFLKSLYAEEPLLSKRVYNVDAPVHSHGG